MSKHILCIFLCIFVYTPDAFCDNKIVNKYREKFSVKKLSETGNDTSYKKKKKKKKEKRPFIIRVRGKDNISGERYDYTEKIYGPRRR